MNAFIDSDFAARLVLTLGHFLWQGLTAGGLVWIAVLAVRRRAGALARYRLYAAALLMMAACPVATFLWLSAEAPQPSASRARVAVTNSDRPDADHQQKERSAPVKSRPLHVSQRPGSESDPRQNSETAEAAGMSSGRAVPPPVEDFDWRRFAPLLAGLYLAGVVIMLVRLALGLRGGRRLRRSAEPVREPAVLEVLSRRASALGLRFVPALAWCRGVAVPTVVGVIRPTILLPLTLSSGLTADQLGAVLTHELAHIRRCDPVVNVLQRIIEAALFFHPVVWLVSRSIRRERERCCDDLVVGLGVDRLAYASSLLEVAERALSAAGAKRPLAAALHATGERSELSGRVRRLIGASPPESVRLNRPGILLVLFAGIFGLLGLALTGEPDDATFPKANPARIVLPNGTVVELLGVAEHYKDQHWWRADGRPLESPPPELADDDGESWVATDDDSMHRALLLKATRLPAKLVHNLSITPEESEHNAGGAFSSTRTSTGLLVRPFVKTPASARMATVRFEFTSGLWETVLTLDPSGEPTESARLAARDVEFGGLTESDADGQSPGIRSSVVLRVPRETSGRRIEYRAVLIDSEGGLHEPARSSSNWSGDEASGTNTMHFKVAPEDVREIRVHASPFTYWAEFRNVSLQSGRRTAVEVESSTAESVRASEFAEVLATRVAEHLPFPRSALRERTRAEFIELVTEYAPQDVSPEFVRGILNSLDAYLQAHFPHGPRADEPVVRDQDYLRLMPGIRNLQWTLFLALQRRPLDAGDQQRLADQLQWMRQHIRSLPDRTDLSGAGDAKVDFRRRALDDLEQRVKDPLFPLFKQPLSDAQFEQFQSKLAEYDRSSEILHVGAHLVWQCARFAFPGRSSEIPVPKLATFHQQPIGLSLDDGNLAVRFPSSDAARGMRNGIDGYQEKSSSLVDLGGPHGPLGLRSLADGSGDEPEFGDIPTLDELDQWFAAREWGEIVFDSRGERIVGVRGTKLVPLQVKRWTEVDRIPADRIRDQIESKNSRLWELPAPVETDVFGGREYDAMAGVLTADDRLFILQLQELEHGTLWFHIREHDPLGLSERSSKN